MGFFDKIFGTRERPSPAHEHAVLVAFQYGSTDLSRLFALEDRLEKAIAEMVI